MKLFAPQPNNDLFKITELDAFTTKRMTKKHPLWNVLKTISAEYIGNQSVSTMTFSKDNFNEPNQTIYAYLDSEANIYFTKSLKNFSEGYRSIKEWKIKSWKEIPMDEIELEEELRGNEIKRTTINAMLYLKEAANKVGFVFEEYDAMDGRFYATFSAPNK